ncbi:MAG: tRNA epoxyqueuosine(34) reductase QueG [Aestuariibacter sp.]
MSSDSTIDYNALAQDIKAWGKALGFQQIGISDTDLQKHKPHLQRWLEASYHGDMSYLQDNIEKRLAPDKLLPGTTRIISVRMNYLPPDAKFAHSLKQKAHAYISRYAVGRDYHKVLRGRLKRLGQQIHQAAPHAQFRPFVDSAPVLEHAIAEKSGIGWTGKHSLTISEQDGSWFFLGELFVNLPLPVDQPVAEKCGSCVACIKICPTGAIVAPYVVDGRKCISYLTIENKGTIPEQYRHAMGNRIYGCDDCQLICPWNRFATMSAEADFQARHQLTDIELLELFHWDEDTFLSKTEGTAIRRIGFERWQRNIAVALGNAPFCEAIVTALEKKLKYSSEMVKEHIHWALQQQKVKQAAQVGKSTTEKTANRLTLRLIRSIEKGLPRDA